MSWYYTWDVPFAQGQMLGDVNFKSRGWSNVSVENNHIDVFVFELPHIVKWLAGVTGETRFAKMYDVIYSSLCQLMPTDEHHFNIAKKGFYPDRCLAVGTLLARAHSKLLEIKKTMI